MDTFYICLKCGHWTNVAFSVMLSNAFAGLKGFPAFPQETGVLCPRGHGAMAQVGIDDKLKFRPLLETAEQPEENQEITAVLKRLALYYKERAKSAGKVARECGDQEMLALKALDASRWEAKYDAVLKVAENLGIELEEKEE